MLQCWRLWYIVRWALEKRETRDIYFLPGKSSFGVDFGEILRNLVIGFFCRKLEDGAGVDRLILLQDLCYTYVGATCYIEKMPMPDIDKVNTFLQKELIKRRQFEVPAVKAAEWLEEAGLLKDSPTRPGLPLRKLLRARLIVGQVQIPNRRYGRWFIRKSRQTNL